MATADTITQTNLKLKTPSLWKVTLHNDDYTPMDFVVRVLIDLFYKSEDEANALMLAVHNAGAANVMLTTKDIAETKADQVVKTASHYGYPLLATAEEA